MKHISVTSKSMPAVAYDGGISTKNNILGVFPRNEFSFWPITGFVRLVTGVDKGDLPYVN